MRPLTTCRPASGRLALQTSNTVLRFVQPRAVHATAADIRECRSGHSLPRPMSRHLAGKLPSASREFGPSAPRRTKGAVRSSPPPWTRAVSYSLCLCCLEASISGSPLPHICYPVPTNPLRMQGCAQYSGLEVSALLAVLHCLRLNLVTAALRQRLGACPRLMPEQKTPSSSQQRP